LASYDEASKSNIEICAGPWRWASIDGSAAGMSESGMSESGTGSSSTISSSMFASDYHIDTFAHERVYQYCKSAYTADGAGGGGGSGAGGAMSDAALDEVSGEVSQTMQRLEAAMAMPRQGGPTSSPCR
jgi:hypothetical protein